MEDFQAYPGARLLNAIEERVAGGDALGTARLVQRVSTALMSRSYRSDAGEWETRTTRPARSARCPPRSGEAAAKPYFEVLFVTPTPPSRWPAHVQQMRKLRRAQDEFVYEPVFVGTFEDAALGVILNTNLEAVVIYDGFPYASSHDVPLLRSVLASRLSVEPGRSRAERLRPEAGRRSEAAPARARRLPARRQASPTRSSPTPRPRDCAASSTRSRSRWSSTSRSSPGWRSATRRRSSTT